MLLISISFLLLTVVHNVSANEINYEDYMRVINNDTQEVAIKIIEINTETISTKASLLSFNISNDFTKEVQIKFDILKLGGINSLVYDDASKNNGAFVAYLRYDYQKGGTTAQPKIKVTSVQGGWKCTSTSYSARFENREVLAKQGNWIHDRKCTLNKKTTFNSFNYSTGWDFVSDLPKTESSGVYVFSTAKAIINGMGGGYTLETKLSS